MNQWAGVCVCVSPGRVTSGPANARHASAAAALWALWCHCVAAKKGPAGPPRSAGQTSCTQMTPPAMFCRRFGWTAVHLCFYLPIYHVTAPRVIRILTETEWNEEFFSLSLSLWGNFSPSCAVSFPLLVCVFNIWPTQVWIWVNEIKWNRSISGMRTGSVWPAGVGINHEGGAAAAADISRHTTSGARPSARPAASEARTQTTILELQLPLVGASRISNAPRWLLLELLFTRGGSGRRNCLNTSFFMTHLITNGFARHPHKIEAPGRNAGVSPPYQPPSPFLPPPMQAQTGSRAAPLWPTPSR